MENLHPDEREYLSPESEAEILCLWYGGACPSDKAAGELLEVLGWDHMSPAKLKEILREEEGRKEVFQQILNQVVYDHMGSECFQAVVRGTCPKIRKDGDYPHTKRLVLDVLNYYEVVESWNEDITCMSAAAWAAQAYNILKEMC